MNAPVLDNEGVGGTWSQGKASPGPSDLYKTSSLLGDKDRQPPHRSPAVGPYNSDRTSPNLSPRLGTSDRDRPSAPMYPKHHGRQHEVKSIETAVTASKGYEDLSWFDLTRGHEDTPKLPCLSSPGLSRKTVSCHAELWRVDMNEDEELPTNKKRPSDWICQQLQGAGNDRTSVSSHKTAGSKSTVSDDMTRRRDRQRELCMAAMKFPESEKPEACPHPQLPSSPPPSTKKLWNHRVTSCSEE